MVFVKVDQWLYILGEYFEVVYDENNKVSSKF